MVVFLSITHHHLSTQAKRGCSHYHRVVSMSTKVKRKEELSEGAIDKIIIAQADDDTVWEEPISVHRMKPISFSIPAELAARATFLAQLHRKASVEEWLTNIIVERIAFEEAAFAGVKQDLATK
jgi:hypothetical protein